MTDELEERVENLERKYQLTLGDIVEADTRIEELEEEKEDLKERVAELEKVVDPDPGSKDYQSMSRPEKVRKLRESLYRKAESKNGTAQLTYDEVLALFDHHPSAGYAYELMERAGYAEGFRYDRMGPNNNGQKRLAVEIQAVKDTESFHGENKAEQSQATA